MTTAALVFGVVGTSLSALSLGWQVWSFWLQGARPTLTPIVGVSYGGGAFTVDATSDSRPFLRSMEAQLPAESGQWIVGVSVVNTGRAALHVIRWSFRALPVGAVYLPGEALTGCPTVPCSIPPGGQETFFTTLEYLRVVMAASEAVGGQPQRLVVAVTTGNRTRLSEPIVIPMIAEVGD